MPDRSPHDAPEVDPEVARRLSAAFAALATSEVPGTVPGNAPRPPARTRAGRGRRWGIAGGSLLVAAAAVVLALLLGSEVFDARVATTAPPASDGPAPVATTSVPPPTTAAPTTPSGPAPSTDPVTPSSSAPDRAAVTAAFTAVTKASRSDVVTVPGGYEGADLDGAGTVRFWRSTDGTAWSVDGASTYPADAPGGTTGFSAVISAAALLTGMDHATFLVDGPFTGDSTGSVLAYTDSDSGWGVIKAEEDGLLHPTGDGFPALGATDAANIGLSRDEGLVGGLLQTTDCSAAAPDNASCGLPAYRVVKFWRWDGTQFVLDRRTGPES